MLHNVEVIFLIFFFIVGSSVGSFINVVVYRLPEGMSIVKPGSHCPACKHPLAWFDNIPIFGWFLLGGHCRYCKAKFSINYALVELLTAILFTGLFWAYFIHGCREGLTAFTQGGWVVYLGHVFLLGVLLASSLIDARHWIIPLSVSYAAVVVGLIMSMIAPYFLDVPAASMWRYSPYVLPKAAAMAIGACFGLLVAFIFVKTGFLKRSFHEYEQACQEAEKQGRELPQPDQVNIRYEMVREMGFLTPVILLALVSMMLLAGDGTLAAPWARLLESQKWLSGLLGSLFGFMIGGGVVWAVRILGSLLFGREAMGLGDVHLMAAVGTILGWQSPTVAFFVAPFFGLGYALVRLIVQRSREIPYGPFLSLATVVVMIWHDPIMNYLSQAFSVVYLR